MSRVPSFERQRFAKQSVPGFSRLRVAKEAERTKERLEFVARPSNLGSQNAFLSTLDSFTDVKVHRPRRYLPRYNVVVCEEGPFAGNRYEIGETAPS